MLIVIFFFVAAAFSFAYMHRPQSDLLDRVYALPRSPDILNWPLAVGELLGPAR
jgi:hypothetical protein